MGVFKSYGFVCVLVFISLSGICTSEESSQNTTNDANITISPGINDSEVTDLLQGNLTNVFEKGNLTEVDDDDLDDVDEAVNGTFVNVTDKGDSPNSTEVIPWANVSALPSIMESNDLSSEPAVGTAESAVILSATFMVLAAVGYGGMVAWRRALQIRYDTRDVLITDDVYDITDLRNFEIA